MQTCYLIQETWANFECMFYKRSADNDDLRNKIDDSIYKYIEIGTCMMNRGILIIKIVIC